MKNKFIYILTVILLLTSYISPYSEANAQDNTPDQANTQDLAKKNVTDYNQMTKKDRCEAEKDFTEQVIARVGHCDTDKECINMNFGCPFGCNSFVNKNERIDVAKSTVAKYISSCGKCEYKCKKETRKPKCVFGRCTVE